MIEQVSLPAADLPDLCAFYAGTLGLPLESDSLGALTVRVGASRLTFEQSAATGPSHFAFSLPAACFRAAKAWLAARRALIVGGGGQDEFDFRDWNARAVYFYDPAGEPFGPADLDSTCEIGLPAEDVPATVERLRTEPALRVYDGAGSDTFTAVGADDGLFIVVRRGREWYPDTGAAAVLQPLSMRLAGGALVQQTRSDLAIRREAV
jgi:catechol 2,3-dioxygenase-like lactoylglutathione lyase family enzyme